MLALNALVIKRTGSSVKILGDLEEIRSITI